MSMSRSLALCVAAFCVAASLATLPQASVATSIIPIPVLILTPKPAPSDTPTPAPSAAPTPIAFFKMPKSGAVFALSLSSDAATNVRISIETASALRDALHNTWVIPVPTWSLADYYTQCARDSNTLGAVVTMPVATRNASEGYVLLNRAWTQVDLVMVAFDCQNSPDRMPSPAPTPTATVTPAATPTRHGSHGSRSTQYERLPRFAMPFPMASATSSPAPTPSPIPRNAVPGYVTKVQSGIGSRNVANLVPLTALFTALQATRPQVTETKIAATAYGAPSPAPSPGAPYPTTSSDQTVTVKNQTTDFTVLGASLFGQLTTGSVNIGSSLSVDAQTAKAVQRAAVSLAKELVASVDDDGKVIVVYKGDAMCTVQRPLPDPPRLCWLSPPLARAQIKSP
jgi:hypothetical protein